MSNATRRPAPRGPAAKKRAVPKHRTGTPRWVPAIITLVGVAAAVIVFIATRPGPPPPPPQHVDYAADLARIRPSELDRVALGAGNLRRFSHVSEAALTSGGKPEVLFMGAEYCPYCAGERWALIVALSRFGSFTNVRPIASSEGNLPTFTFHGSTFTSSYLAFTHVELEDRDGNVLETPTAAESALEQKHSSGIPFVDFGNRAVFDGATYDVSVLQGLTWQQIIDQLNHDPASGPAQGILGSANLITAEICDLTGQQPGGVCSDPVIQQLEKQLPQ